MKFLLICAAIVAGWSWPAVASMRAAMAISPVLKNVIMAAVTLAIVALPLAGTPRAELRSATWQALWLAAIMGVLNGTAFALYQPLLKAIPAENRSIFVGSIIVLALSNTLLATVILNHERIGSRKAVFFTLAILAALAGMWAGVEKKEGPDPPPVAVEGADLLVAQK